ncbi:hypothetical protein [Pseudomonas sp. ok266]|uniref:hypothetical protein n=1 Tax=Pseudomonas sp. ok266 TaxID=1761896 RepID=UPI0008C516C4|nr:hypothetical protein [Pseudomonas sp. ok266]SEM93131.1 hypothetical protein SAMN04487856_101349 [Pseudomonas sp. ok266]
MKFLTIKLSVYDTPIKFYEEAEPALPLKVLAIDGSVLAEFALANQDQRTVSLPRKTKKAYVKLYWPSGKTATESVDFSGTDEATVSIGRGKVDPIPNRNRHYIHRSSNIIASYSLKFPRMEIWLRLYQSIYDADAPPYWKVADLGVQHVRPKSDSWQIELNLPHGQWMLQVGGEFVRWRFTTLPTGKMRILISPPSTRLIDIDITITSDRENADNLIEFLARDSLRAADAIAESAYQNQARSMFSSKFLDPMSAVAGAYYLLRRGGWANIHVQWYENLARSCYWCPDGIIILCAFLLKKGLKNQELRRDFIHDHIKRLERALRRGWPVYREGIELLGDIAAELSDEIALDIQNKIRHLRIAQSWAGPWTCFWGALPEHPDQFTIIGMPDKARIYDTERVPPLDLVEFHSDSKSVILRPPLKNLF